MLSIPEHSEPINLGAIRSFLLSDRVPGTSVGLSDLDGFLTAIAIGPETILPSEWLPVIWGGEDSVFGDLDEARNVSSLIVASYKDIVTSLQLGPDDWAPVFGEAEGKVIVANWAAGFLDGVDLRPEAWGPLFEDREAAVLMVPILLTGGEAGIAHDMGVDEAHSAAWLEAAAEHIPLAVIAIETFWTQRRTQRLSPQSSAHHWRHDLPPQPSGHRHKPGRARRPCPCGSGKGFKRCCGAH